MIKIEYDRKFKKNYRKRILPNKKLRDKFTKRLNIYIKNPTDSILKNHRLQGVLKEFHAFWITGNIRVVYKRLNDTIRLYDIGTHPQVYGM